MAYRTKRYYSTLICQACGLKMTIPRPKGKRRKEGHIKTMYCAMCKDKRDFVECNTITLAEREGNNGE